MFVSTPGCGQCQKTYASMVSHCQLPIANCQFSAFSAVSVPSALNISQTMVNAEDSETAEIAEIGNQQLATVKNQAVAAFDCIALMSSKSTCS